MASVKRFFMTGSASGIGRHLTDILVQAGHCVFATDIDVESLEGHARRRDWPSERVRVGGLDVRDPEQWERVFSEAVSAFDHIDVSMSVPGVMRINWIADTPVEDIHRQLDTNVKGVVFGTQTAARHMIERRSGHIVNFGSLAGAAPVPGMSVYCATKYAVRGFSVAVARELRCHGVYVSVVCPDAVDTPLLDIPHIHDEEAAMAFSGARVLDVEEVGRAVMKKVLRGKPEVFCIPRHRGWQARFGEAFPSFMKLVTPFIQKQGRARQARREKAAASRR